MLLYTLLGTPFIYQGDELGLPDVDIPPEAVVDALAVYTDLGFNHLGLHGPGNDQERFLRTLAEQVLPGLRELIPAQR